MARRVIIVDDEPLIVEMLADTLEAEGFETIGITCAEEASRRIAEHADFDGPLIDSLRFTPEMFSHWWMDSLRSLSAHLGLSPPTRARRRQSGEIMRMNLP